MIILDYLTVSFYIFNHLWYNMDMIYGENNLVYFNKELIVVNNDVEMWWSGRDKQYYIDREYVCVNWNESFFVKVQDLKKTSGKKVTAICPRCDYRRDLEFKSIMKIGHSKCKSCTRFIDKTGKKYKYCKVLEYDSVNKWGNARWKCLCRCGEIFYPLGQSLESGQTTSCGCIQREIASELMTSMTGDKNHMYGRRGDKSPSWDPNLTDDDRNKQRSQDDNDWAKAIKQLDNFTCQSCDKYSGDLVSHHLDKYSDFPEQRLDLNNGVTLCKTCHKEFHIWMGGTQKLCTRDNFICFLEQLYSDAPFLQ